MRGVRQLGNQWVKHIREGRPRFPAIGREDRQSEKSASSQILRELAALPFHDQPPPLPRDGQRDIREFPAVHLRPPARCVQLRGVLRAPQKAGKPGMLPREHVGKHEGPSEVQVRDGRMHHNARANSFMLYSSSTDFKVWNLAERTDKTNALSFCDWPGSTHSSVHNLMRGIGVLSKNWRIFLFRAIHELGD